MKQYLTATFSALAIRDYRRYAFGQTISVSGTWMQKLAQSWLVLELTNSPLLLGFTVAAQQLPTLLFTTTGGALADRFDKRTILVCTQFGAMVPALVLGLLVQFHLATVWTVMVAALVQGFSDAIDKPARLTVVNDIATPETLTNAVTLNGIIQNSGKVAGPAVAGILIGTIGIAPAFFINAASFVPVIVALLLIRPHVPVGPVAKFKASGNLTGTLRYVGKHPKLASALALMAVAGLLAYNFNVLLPTLMRDTMGGDARTVGFAFTSMGLGGVIGGLALAGVLRGKFTKPDPQRSRLRRVPDGSRLRPDLRRRVRLPLRARRGQRDVPGDRDVAPPVVFGTPDAGSCHIPARPGHRGHLAARWSAHRLDLPERESARRLHGGRDRYGPCGAGVLLIPEVESSIGDGADRTGGLRGAVDERVPGQAASVVIEKSA